MNKISSFGIAVLALTTVFVSGCDKVKDLDDFKFQTSFEESIAMVDPTVGGVDKDYKGNVTVDATTDSNVEKYKSKIKSFTVDKVTYTLDNSENPTKGAKFNGTLGFSDSDGGSATVLTTLTNIDLDDHTTVHEVTFSDADLAKLASYLNTSKAFKIYVDGKVSKTPINVIVNVKVAVSVVANAL